MIAQQNLINKALSDNGFNVSADDEVTYFNAFMYSLIVSKSICS